MNKTVERVEMRNVMSPGHVVRVEKAKYEAMKDALLIAVPAAEPGLTVAEIKARVLPMLPEDLFPGGAKAGWWLKGVQLDLEARGILARENVKPLRLRRL
ncbi:MAG: hypothetical protein Q7T68_10955 [Sphingopyxis sp.]|nr:hypothetical protein [Sphingopyxis sp.]